MAQVPNGSIDTALGFRKRHLAHLHSGTVVHGDGHVGRAGIVTEVEVHNRACRGVLSAKDHVSRMSAVARVPYHRRRLHAEEVYARGYNLGRHFLECGDVVEDPHAASVCAEDQIVVPGMQREIVDGESGQVVPQRDPVLAVVIAVEQSQLCAEVQHAGAAEIFPYRAQHAVVGKIAHNGGP